MHLTNTDRPRVRPYMEAASRALMVVWAAQGPPPTAAGAWPLATIRTAVLVAGVLLLAWAGRRERWHEAGWLAYPLLALAGLKLLLDDLVHSGPAALVVAFGLYGGALILVPRLRRLLPPRSGGQQSADDRGLVPGRRGRAG